MGFRRGMAATTCAYPKFQGNDKKLIIVLRSNNQKHILLTVYKVYVVVKSTMKSKHFF
jgi:hypothetical protein